MRALLSRPGRGMRRTPTSRRETFCPPNLPIRRALAVTASPPNGRRTKRRGSRGRTTAIAGPASSRASSRPWSSSCARSRRASRCTSMSSMPSTSGTSASCSRAAVPSERLRLFRFPTNDAWARDHGAIFVTRPDGQGAAARRRFRLQRLGRQVPAVRSRSGDRAADGRGARRPALRAARRRARRGLDRGQRRRRAADDGAMPAEPEPQSDADARRHRAPVARHRRRPRDPVARRGHRRRRHGRAHRRPHALRRAADRRDGRRAEPRGSRTMPRSRRTAVCSTR